MGSVKYFEELITWKKARQLTKEIYDASNQGPFAGDFGLRNQIRRASVSIVSNIAEGFERGWTTEFMQFLSMAKGSTGEVKTQLYIAFTQGYLDQGAFDRLTTLTVETGQLIGGLIRYLQKTQIRGSKYH